MQTPTRAEPRGLTLFDLIVLIAGVGLALGLPELYPRPVAGAQGREPGELLSVWLQFLAEQAGRLGLAFGLAALVRCARYGRPIRAPEFLALTIGWGWLLIAATQPKDAWISFYKIEYGARSFSQTLDREVYATWHHAWFAAASAAASCLAIGPVRRRLPGWLAAILLLVAWQGFTASIYYFNYVLGLFVWQGTASERASAWAVMALATIAHQAPLAFALAHLRGRYRSCWTLLAWISLGYALIALAIAYADQAVTHLVWKSYSTSPEIERLSALQSLLLPLVTLAFVTPVLAIATRGRPNEPPAPDARPAP